MSKHDVTEPFAVGDSVVYKGEELGIVSSCNAGYYYPIAVEFPRSERTNSVRTFTKYGAECYGSPVVLRHATALPSTVAALTKEPVEAPTEQTSAFDTQVGGGHYSSRPDGYQPFQISKVLELNPVEHTVLKYLLRHRDKNGAVDLRKAKHCLDILIEQEYPNAN